MFHLSPNHPPSQCPEHLHGPDIKSIPVPAGRHDWCSCHHRPLCNCQTAIYENGWSMGNDLSLMIMVTDSYDHGQFKKCWGPLQAFLRFYRKAVSAGKSTCFYLYCFCWRLTMGPPARLTEILQATSFRGKNQVFTYTVFAGDNGALQAVCCKTDLSRKWRP